MTLHLARSRWGSVLIGVLAATLAITPAQAVPGTTGDKVSAKVWAAAENSDKITFWVTFHAKASLTTAASLTSKTAKGAEVRRAKIATADTSQAGVRELLDNTGADYQTFWISNRIKVTGSPKLLDLIAARPEVAAIEEDKSIKLPEPIAEPSGVPSIDGVEWGVDRIAAPRVWAELGTRGDGIVVANIDSGVQFDHPALANQYRGRAANGAIDHNYNWFDPSNVCSTPAPCDNNDHGTHTMGTMVGDDGGGNQIGVAPGAKWIAAKGCETSSCSESALLASGEWIVAPTDLSGANPRPDLAPDIVNNSWGGSGYDAFYEEIVAAWIAAGIFPAFSNGNSGPSCNTSGSPGQYVESYSSGAFDVNNTIAGFSSRGSGESGEIKPNLAAPGVNVRSSIPGGYDNFSGTSMASPHTAGTVALIWSASPTLRGDIAATRELLDNAAVDVDATTCGGTVDDNNVFGEGRLDAFAAVSNAPRGPLGALNGTITSGGVPLEGATVVATGPISRTVTTGADGTYAFPVLSVGDYAVSANKYGYITATGNATVTDGATTTLDLSLVQAPSATVSGTVTAGGGVVAGARVALLGTPVAGTTNDAGFYSLTAPQGTYELQLSSPLQCFTSITREVNLNADLTVDVDLPVRTDEFGYACGNADGSYPQASTLVDLTGDDQRAVVDLPFAVPFYGINYTSISVTTNGSAAFGAASSTQTNREIPSTLTPNGALYPMWDDLMVDASAGVYTTVVGTAPHRRFVIEWRNVRSYFDAEQRLSFAAEIGEDGGIIYRYKDVAGTSYESGSSATIGLENETGTVAFQYSFNTSVLTDGTAIAFRTTKHGVVRGTVTDANDGDAIAAATLDFGDAGTATTAADGTYLAQLPAGELSATVAKENYEAQTITATLAPAGVQVLDASLRTARISTSPGHLQLVVPPGQTRTRLVTVTNSGGLATPVTLSEVGGDVPWLGASLGSNSLDPGASTVLAVTVNTAGLTSGSVHTAALQLTSASGRNPDLLVPVKLVVPGFQQAVDAGARGSHVDPQGDIWTEDAEYVAGEGCGYLGRSRIVRTNRHIDGTDDPARFANARQNMYEYRCDGLADGTYTVELDFAEVAGLAPNKRIFDVMIEGAEVIPNLDIALEGGHYTALTRTFTVTVTDGVLNIRFVRHSGFRQPIVSALRVTHRPDLG